MMEFLAVAAIAVIGYLIYAANNKPSTAELMEFKNKVMKLYEPIPSDCVRLSEYKSKHFKDYAEGIDLIIRGEFKVTKSEFEKSKNEPEENLKSYIASLDEMRVANKNLIKASIDLMTSCKSTIELMSNDEDLTDEDQELLDVLEKQYEGAAIKVKNLKKELMDLGVEYTEAQ